MPIDQHSARLPPRELRQMVRFQRAIQQPDDSKVRQAHRVNFIHKLNRELRLCDRKVYTVIVSKVLVETWYPSTIL